MLTLNFYDDFVKTSCLQVTNPNKRLVSRFCDVKISLIEFLIKMLKLYKIDDIKMTKWVPIIGSRKIHRLFLLNSIKIVAILP